MASYLYAQLEEADTINNRRRSLFDRYMQALAPLATEAGVGIPVNPPDTTGNGHMFYLLMPSIEARSAFILYMRQKGIGTPFHYVPLHSAAAGLRFGRSHGSMSVTDRVSDTLVRMPMFFDLGAEVETVIDAVSVYIDMRSAELHA